MKLTAAQLSRIRGFIRKKGFTEWDLQLEILDHVACRVEEKMEADPQLGFEQALEETHAGFGIFGFSAFEDSMRASLARKYRMQLFAEAKKWIGFPRILLTLLLGTSFYHLYQSLLPKPLIIAVASFNFFAILYFYFRQWRSQNRYKNLMTMRASLLFLYFPALIFQLWVNLSRYMNQTTGAAFAFSAMFVVLLFFICSSVRIQQYAVDRCRELEAAYPDVL